MLGWRVEEMNRLRTNPMTIFGLGTGVEVALDGGGASWARAATSNSAHIKNGHIDTCTLAFLLQTFPNTTRNADEETVCVTVEPSLTAIVRSGYTFDKTRRRRRRKS